MTTEAHVHHPNYVKIWAILVALLIVSVLGSMSHVRVVLLIAAFGVALVKAYLVAKNFMHVNVEKRWVPYLLVMCLLFIVILFAGVAPDVMKHSGLHWNKNPANQQVQSGAERGNQNMSSPTTTIESRLPALRAGHWEAPAQLRPGHDHFCRRGNHVFRGADERAHHRARHRAGRRLASRRPAAPAGGTNRVQHGDIAAQRRSAVCSAIAARATATKRRAPIWQARSPRELPSCCCRAWNGSRCSAKA